ncbi:MAG: pantoate--beta-alanine ligase [Dehalococcoidia bacterium]|nr:pantoate--beta-alanine ligase [Dehalococcoidia bacterium]
MEPDRAYFGRKDAQQLRVIRRMVRDFDMGIDVVPCPIIRESDGLAMSSRNVYLSPEERAAAVVISQALREAQDAHQSGERDAVTLRSMVQERLSAEPLARPEYVSLADDDSLEEIRRSLRPGRRCRWRFDSALRVSSTTWNSSNSTRPAGSASRDSMREACTPHPGGRKLLQLATRPGHRSHG